MVNVTNIDGEHYGAVYGTLRGLKSAISLFKPDEVYVVMDGPNAGIRRKQKSEDYKANRKKEFKRGVIKAYDFLNEQDKDANFSFQLSRLEEYLNILPIKQIRIPYVEADDVIAEIVNTMEENFEAIIYSTDADYKQLVNERVSCYNPTARIMTDEKTFFEKHGYLPVNYIYFKCVNGDKSDGISGINGIGEKTFLKMYPSVVTEKLEGIQELVDMAQHELDSGKKNKGLLNKYQSIVDNKEMLQLNWELMQLHDANISIQAKTQVENLMERESQEFNRRKLRMMFLGDKLNQQVKYFEGWVDPFLHLVTKQRRMLNG